VFAGSSFANTVSPAKPTIKLESSEQSLQAAYKKAWSSLDRMYAGRDKLTGDWPLWKDKFVGQLHTEQDLTNALNDLVARVGDPQVRILTTAQVAVINAKESGGHFGYGLQAKFLPVLGPFARLHVDDEVNACAGEHCWHGEGQGHIDGLRDGDILYAVDGKSFAGMDTWDLYDYVVTHQGPLTFSVKRGKEFMDIVVHPQDDRPMNFNLDIGVTEIGDYVQPFVFADAQGPAIQAGIAEKDVLESVNGKPADQMTSDELRQLNGECTLGESLRLKVRRLPNEVTIACGLVPYGDNLNGNGGGVGPADAMPWQFSIHNLDDPRATAWVERFLADYTKLAAPGSKQVEILATIDLRGSTGSNNEAAQKIASLFIQNGPLSCLTAGWRSDKLCDVVKDGAVQEDGGRRQTTEPSAPFNGQIAVIIDDDTNGTALLLAAELQENGAKIITTGKAVRHLPDLFSQESLLGDPSARWIRYADFHRALSNGSFDFTADIVVAKGEEFNKVQELFKLTFAPYDLHHND